jgi:hypothetical protein
MAISLTNLEIKNISVIELGNIIIKNCLDIKGKISAKDWLFSKDVKNHISIDINGKNGVLALDLGTRLNQFDNQADLISNCGTAEHVNNIWECFNNIHYFCREGGIMLNWGPPVGTAKWHSPWAYPLHFPYEFCRLNGYDLLYQDIRIEANGKNKNPKDNTLICWIARKKDNKNFISKEDFIKIGPERRIE